MLQLKTIHEDTFELLQKLSAIECLKNFSLAGGTSLALQLGLRISFLCWSLTPMFYLKRLVLNLNSGDRVFESFECLLDTRTSWPYSSLMKKKDLVKSLLSEFHHRLLPEFIPRESAIPVDLDKIITLVGPRRSGKTLRLYQIATEILQNNDKTSLIFLNFEDERLDLDVQDLDLIIQAYRELYPERDLADCTFFFDEIQNVPGWEHFIRRVYDTLSRHIFLTGFNAKILSSEIATSLRGRSISLPYSGITQPL